MFSREGPSAAAVPLTEVAEVLSAFARFLVRLPHNEGRTLTELGVLRLLGQEGPQRITDLAVRQELTQPGMTQLITRMERAGLVSRAPDPRDGRVVLVTATDAGRAVFANRNAERVARFTELYNQLDDDERERLRDALPVLTRLMEIKEAEADE